MNRSLRFRNAAIYDFIPKFVSDLPAKPAVRVGLRFASFDWKRRDLPLHFFVALTKLGHPGNFESQGCFRYC